MVDSDNPSPHVMCCQEDMDDLEAVDMQSQQLVWFGEVSLCNAVLCYNVSVGWYCTISVNIVCCVSCNMLKLLQCAPCDHVETSARFPVAQTSES